MPAVLAFRWPRCVAACWFAALCWWQPVAVSGSIARMGLVVPHLARLLVGADHRRLLPTAFWLGAALMLVVDDLARTLTRAEIPIGIITALLGAPLFTVLLVQSRRRSTTR